MSVNFRVVGTMKRIFPKMNNSIKCDNKRSLAGPNFLVISQGFNYGLGCIEVDLAVTNDLL